MRSFIHVFEYALPLPFCDELVLYFEHNSARHVTQELNGVRKFTEMQIGEQETRMQTTLIEAQDNVLKQYREIYQLYDHMFPASYGYETFRVKRYRPESKEEYVLHTDVGDHASARRFIAFLWYLNDLEKGGETSFPEYGTILPKKGNVLVFPPLWTYPHAGLPPISGPKWVVSSYCHYL